jgi:XTP/dITP diphosphohydrolase
MATRNRGKISELKKLLPDIEDVHAEIYSLEDLPGIPETEETGVTFLENALLKAGTAADFSGFISLADDSGLVVDALGGKPGVYSARFAGESCNDTDNNQKVLQLLEGIPFNERTARFVSSIAIVTPDGESYNTEGICEGIILEEPRGSGGFGYDPLFYIPELGKTMAELNMEEKNKISHRGKALRASLPILRKLLGK